jgi:hypothetical protein
MFEKSPVDLILETKEKEEAGLRDSLFFLAKPDKLVKVKSMSSVPDFKNSFVFWRVFLTMASIACSSTAVFV